MKNSDEHKRKEEKIQQTQGRWFSENDIATRDVSIDFVLKGLPRGDISTVFGNGGVGKGFFIQHFLTSADNMLYEKQIKIAYLTFEDPIDVISIRYKNQKLVYPDACHEFDVLDAIGLHLFQIGSNKEKTVNLQLFKEIFEHNDYDLIILDTWAMASWQFEENSNSDLTQAMFLLKTVARKFGCSFMLVHHTNKSALNAENSTNEGALRGASSIIGNSRLVVSIKKGIIEKNGKKEFNDNQVIAKMDKVNFISPEEQTLWRGANGVLLTTRPNPL